MTSYSPVPLDANRTPMQNYVGQASCVGTYAAENASASSVISLSHDTTTIEIAAIGNSAVMRWVRTGDGQASVISAVGGNFHHVIGSGTVRQFVVPQETNTGSPASVQGLNRRDGLFQRVAIKSIGTASVLVNEFTLQSN